MMNGYSLAKVQSLIQKALILLDNKQVILIISDYKVTYFFYITYYLIAFLLK